VNPCHGTCRERVESLNLADHGPHPRSAHTLVLDRAVGLPERLPGSNAGERGSPREALVGVGPVLWQHYRARSQG
jgi:hypothetical protein